jgi:aspartyl-tRNA(Asn)/glutamyl-tRNA(Gln) amidotransferase subunit C
MAAEPKVDRYRPEDRRAREARPRAGEEKELAGQFASILRQFRVLETLDVSGVEAMVGASGAGEVFREDVPVPSFPVEEMLRNAPEHTPEFYVVPKTIGGEA